MSLGVYFAKKCLDKMQENVALTLAKLSDPMSLVKVNVSGAIVDAAAGGLGSLADFAGDYIKSHAEQIALFALQASGAETKILDALNVVYNMIAAAAMAQNDLIMMFMKNVARSAVIEIDKKKAIIDDLKIKIQALYNALVILCAGNPVWEKYLAQLRQALIDLETSRQEIVLVRNTLGLSDRYLGRTFDTARSRLIKTKLLVKPLENNPYLKASWKGLLANLGVPATNDQINATIMIPKLSKEVINAAKGYLEHTMKLDALILAFIEGLNSLNLLMPSVIKKYVLGLFDGTLNSLQNLIWSMAKNLNGNEQAIRGPAGGFEPSPLNVSVNVNKWAMDLSVVIEYLKVIPSDQLKAISVSLDSARVYQSVVTSIKRKTIDRTVRLS